MSSLLSGGRGSAGRAAFEAIAACLLIGLIIVVAMSYYSKTVVAAREVALQSELTNIRTAIQLFFALNRRFPESLEELMDKKVMIPDQEFRIEDKGRVFERKTPFNRTYLDPRAVDQSGRMLDPSGVPYLYNPQRGVVSPGAEQYHGW